MMRNMYGILRQVVHLLFLLLRQQHPTRELDLHFVKRGPEDSWNFKELGNWLKLTLNLLTTLFLYGEKKGR